MALLYLKAIHIIFVVTWFAGMFYMVRLLIYNREAQDRQEPGRTILESQYGLMMRRLQYGITWPSAVLTLVLGLGMLHEFIPIPTWLWAKIGIVFLLYLYQISIEVLYSQQRKGLFKYTSTQLRVWNELATVFLVAIVFLVVVKSNMSLVYGLGGLLVLMVVLFVAIQLYRRARRG